VQTPRDRVTVNEKILEARQLNRTSDTLATKVFRVKAQQGKRAFSSRTPCFSKLYFQRRRRAFFV